MQNLIYSRLKVFLKVSHKTTHDLKINFNINKVWHVIWDIKNGKKWPNLTSVFVSESF